MLSRGAGSSGARDTVCRAGIGPSTKGEEVTLICIDGGYAVREQERAIFLIKNPSLRPARSMLLQSKPLDIQGSTNYAGCRRLDLPITSALMESTVKRFGRRVKGTDKLWSESGSGTMPQLRADFLSDPAFISPTRLPSRSFGKTGKNRQPAKESTQRPIHVPCPSQTTVPFVPFPYFVPILPICLLVSGRGRLQRVD